MKSVPRILLITEAPNSEAAVLKHHELFDIEKNRFSQFFVRALLGREAAFRRFFNDTYFVWMHAKGSTCHGDSHNDGKVAIRARINTGEHSLIVAFGLPAARVFFSHREANLAHIASIMRGGPVHMEELRGAHAAELRGVTARVAFLPHISGENQSSWTRYAGVFSDCLVSVQTEVLQTIGDETASNRTHQLKNGGATHA